MTMVYITQERLAVLLRSIAHLSDEETSRIVSTATRETAKAEVSAHSAKFESQAAELARLRAKRDAALSLWPRDCRLCANYTTKAGGCVSVVQCVDSMQFRPTAPRQYWSAGHNAELMGRPLADGPA